MRIGLVGLGKMGGNMRERMRRNGQEVVGYDRNPDLTDVPSLAALVEALPAPRAVWVMVPSGAITQSTIDELARLLSPGDILIDGGNSNWRDSLRRGQEVGKLGIGFVDCGTSGGIWGLEEGYCLMVGGAPEVVSAIEPAFYALAQEGGYAHVGGSGAGHFTKMVHNGVEYGMMQALGEGYELLQAASKGGGPVIDMDKSIEVWRHGSVVRSWLLDLLGKALHEEPGLASIRGYADDSGEGRWTVQEAVNFAVPAPVLTAALYSRFASRQTDPPAMKVVAALRNQFGGHAVKKQ